MGAGDSKQLSSEARGTVNRLRELDIDGKGYLEMRRLKAIINGCTFCKDDSARMRVLDFLDAFSQEETAILTADFCQDDRVRDLFSNIFRTNDDWKYFLSSFAGTASRRVDHFLLISTDLMHSKTRNILLGRYYRKLGQQHKRSRGAVVDAYESQSHSHGHGQSLGHSHSHSHSSHRYENEHDNDVVLMDEPIRAPKPLRRVERPRPSSVTMENWENEMDEDEMDRSHEEVTFMSAPKPPSVNVPEEPKPAPRDTVAERLEAFRRLKREREQAKAEAERQQRAHRERERSHSEDRSTLRDNSWERPAHNYTFTSSSSRSPLLFDEVRMGQSVGSTDEPSTAMSNTRGRFAPQPAAQRSSTVPPPKAPFMLCDDRAPVKTASPKQAARIARQRATSYRIQEMRIKKANTPHTRGVPCGYRETRSSKLRRQQGGMPAREMKTNILKKWIEESERTVHGEEEPHHSPAHAAGFARPSTCLHSHGHGHSHSHNSHPNHTLSNFATLSDPRVGLGGYKSNSGAPRTRPTPFQRESEAPSHNTVPYPSELKKKMVPPVPLPPVPGTPSNRGSYSSMQRTRSPDSSSRSHSPGTRGSLHVRRESIICGLPVQVSEKGKKQGSPVPSPRQSIASSSYYGR